MYLVKNLLILILQTGSLVIFICIDAILMMYRYDELNTDTYLPM